MADIYVLAGYDKDNDVYEELGRDSSLDVMKKKAEDVLRRHIENGPLRRRTGSSSEPFDWFVVMADDTSGDIVLTYTTEFPQGTDIFNTNR